MPRPPTPAAALMVLTALLMAGCGTPAQEGDAGAQEDAVAFAGHALPTEPGLYLVTLRSNESLRLSLAEGLAWMSPDGLDIVWQEVGYDVHLSLASGQREVVRKQPWARLVGQGAGLVLSEGEARLVGILEGETLATQPAPTPPERAGGPRFWLGASDARDVWATEYAEPGAGPRACRNAIVVQAPMREDHVGCHVRVAPDGRVAWATGAGIVVRSQGGALENATADAAAPARHENPVFVGDGVAYLRVVGARGGADHATEVVLPDGRVAAHLKGSDGLALHDASEDGELLLLRVFDRR